MLIVTVVMQIVITIIVGLALLIAGLSAYSTEFWVVMAVVLAVTISANLVLVLGVLALPLRDLTAALTHVSGEPTDILPPSINMELYKRDGFSVLLQFIYELAMKDPKHPTDSTSQHTSESAQLLETALRTASSSIVILDEKATVTYASAHAPVTRTSDGTLTLDLLFEEGNDLKGWLKNCTDKLVRDEKTWLRVPDSITGQPDRRIFDITANYEQASDAPVVLLCFNRTELYQPEDDQLDFISFAAHELRGPVTVIRGYLGVLGQELPSTAEFDEHRLLLTRLSVSANRLSGYISNILNASRYDRRHLKLSLRKSSVGAIYALIQDDMQLRASTQNRLLSVTIPPDLPDVAVDASSMSEVFGNLIDNALKYSFEGGSVDVVASSSADRVRIDIIDHGIGMPANVVRNLFHKFYRSHRSRETVAGTGIGLYISKAIVESHGGQVEVKSEEGSGSTFSVILPTYDSVADKISVDASNDALIKTQHGWIKNHASYRG